MNERLMARWRSPALLVPLAVLVMVALLSSCGGGGGSGGSSAMDPGPGPSGSDAGTAAVSSGTITAFGSVFVNGHEYATGSAVVIDDDTGDSTSSTDGLEVGMVADVKPASASTSAHPMAAELHVHALARGVVDASDTGASTLTVMGQTVQLSSATTFTDHRACLTDTASPCDAITGQSGLSVTAGATPGSYVSVDGYLYGSGGAQIVATLVSIRDLPGAGNGYPAVYKAEGVVTAVGATSITIGGLVADLSASNCFNGARRTSSACAGLFAVGQVASVHGTAAPTGTSAFAAKVAILRDKLPVETAGAAVEIEGRVSTINGSTFSIRGFSVDASALPSAGLPVVGDVVRVQGTVAAGGATITASSISVIHAVATASYGFAGPVGAVAAGSAANTYTLTVLGQSIAVNASTRLADLSVRGGHRGDSNSRPFNIATFRTYLAASASQSVQVQTAADASGNLTATSVVIVPATTVAMLSGVVDATPAPANGTPTTFSIHGVAVSADPSAIVSARRWRLGTGSSTPSIAAGDFVIVRGTAVANAITVAPVTSLRGLLNNVVIDSGVPPSRDGGCF
ncbi:DUF5666 domain-containing protein [Pelomonas sp. KK5]|uniref:DUF5666 domain-containing protein n=1 Tax=Pelomonas sp. KK5 TaxID=1855730 RepID=UPI00097BB0BF|nr:DUF5666 domain-containing protein [Pelomonas sp. KK5]